jgi:hypothetical protein
MELIRIIKSLNRHRPWLAAGVFIAVLAAMVSVFQVSLFPPKLTSRTNVFATASTQMLVDTPSSSFANLAEEVEPLSVRASVFSRFLASPVAIDLIAREANLPADAIAGQGPYEQGLPLFQQEPTAEKRSSEIIGERALYRLRFENNPNLPIISVFAQAPDRDAAITLADAVPAALHSYIHGIQVAQKTPEDRRVEIRQLGDATGGVVNAGVNVQIAALVFFVVIFLWCLLLIPARTIARGWQSGGDDDGPRPSGRANGNGQRHPRKAVRPYFDSSAR